MRNVRQAPLSELEERLAMHLKAAGIQFKREFNPIPERRWRWDFYVYDGLLRHYLVECQGSTWAKGAHSSGAGLHRDYEKNNAAILAGWRVLYFDKQMIESGEALRTIERALGRPVNGRK